MSNIFDSHGRINTDIDVQTILPDRRDAFTALVAAQAKCEAAEGTEKIVNDKVAEAVKAHDRAHAAVPHSDFLSEWRRSVGR
jgi:hypothetical protein